MFGNKKHTFLVLILISFIYYSLIVLENYDFFQSEVKVFEKCNKNNEFFQINNNNNIPDEMKRETIREMMQHAWKGYQKYAWGRNELRPLSKKSYENGVFGRTSLGVTIIDSLDTLYIMNLMEEFKIGYQWLIDQFVIDDQTFEVSVFEVNIRMVGGLLSCFSLTGDVIFRDKAQQIVDKLLPAFNTPTGIPLTLINFKTGKARNFWWPNHWSILANFGTLHLEFVYLSHLTKNPIYEEKVKAIRQFLFETEKPEGIYRNYVNPNTGQWGPEEISLGQNGDSFYEYLLKSFIQSNETDELSIKMFENATNSILNKLLIFENELTYFGEISNGKLLHRMHHLTCFTGGLFALAFKYLDKEIYMEIANNITNTCHEIYDRTEVKLGPEVFQFGNSNRKYYALRPEVVESYFIMYRLTKNQKYRDWGWDVVIALQEYCRTPYGFSGIKNVYDKCTILDDVQQSYFLAETLKYLYLLFSNETLLSLDEWVFNTEGHPLPVIHTQS